MSLIGIGSIIGGIGAVGNSLAMINQGKRDRENMGHAAKINYKYNEMAAENAQERQNEFYKMTYDMNKPSAQMENYKEAGLNPALLYSGGGGGGSNGGSVGGTQGGGGGNQSAQRTEEIKMAKIQNSIAMAQAGAQIDVAKSQAELNREEAEKKRQETENQWWSNFDKSVNMLFDGDTGALSDDPGAKEALYKLFDSKPGQKLSLREKSLWERLKTNGLQQSINDVANTEADTKLKVAQEKAQEIIAKAQKDIGDAALKPYEKFKMSDYKDMGVGLTQFILQLARALGGK